MNNKVFKGNSFIQIMPKVKVVKEMWKCIKCGHEWEERKNTEQGKPFVCPKCKNPRWDTKVKKK